MSTNKKATESATPPDPEALRHGDETDYFFKELPFNKWWPLLAGVIAGIGLRALFSGGPGERYATMMGAFILLTPAVVGAVTIYVAETKRRRHWAYYFWAPFAANVMFVLGTLLINYEGLICAIVIVPLMALIGAVGGVIMGVVCRLTSWPRPALYSFAVLPIVLGAFEGEIPTEEHISKIERSTLIAATPDQVWLQLHDTHDIRPAEVGHAWAYRIGVPLPLAGVAQKTPEGLVRKVTMGKGVHFDQVSTEWRENQYVRWTYRFYEDSFPPNAFDDHVVIGGHYFDLKDTSYTLTPRGDATELTIRVHYRVSTHFNWYADTVAQTLLGNFSEVILDFYRRRSESAHATTATQST
ncbi:MAG TPA: SRPBCC domain-containing protein [Burkholderiales bacterium]